MDFFDRELTELENQYRINTDNIPDDAQCENTEAENAVLSQDKLQELFWGSIIISQKRRSRVSIAINAIIGIIVIVLTCCAITTAIVGKGWLKGFFSGNDHISFTLPLYDTPQLDDVYYEADGRYTTEGLAKALSPSVVAINVYYDFSATTLTATTAQGSGIIVSEDGYIVTNAHVIDGTPLAIKVTLHNDEKYVARIVGSDVKSDIAVIKIDKTGLSPAQFANSDNVHPGEDVAAIGNPAGLFGSITKGVVSAVGRDIRTSAEMIEMECIQIDAAINPGNSGGALFNMWGQVVGIISSKMNAAQFDGIGFAISTNAAKPIIEELIEKGCVSGRTRIGITFYGIDETSAQIYGYPIAGLYISNISSDCDISNTELKPGDVITHMNGHAVSDLTTTTNAIADCKPGDTVTAQVSRLSEDGKTVESTFEIQFKLEEDNSMTSGFEKE